MSYNGWKNRETWNAALWISNDEGLYNIAKGCENYSDFFRQMWELDFFETPDGVAWNDPDIDRCAMDEVIRDLREDS